MIPLGTNIQRVCYFLVGHTPDAEFSERRTEMTIDRWDDATPQPTDQEIIDAADDLTTINGQVFSQWLPSYGGDLVLTLRREAKERLAEATAEAVKLRAVLVYISKKHNALLAWLGTQTTLANRAQLNDFAITRAEVDAAIDAGDGD